MDRRDVPRTRRRDLDNGLVRLDGGQDVPALDAVPLFLQPLEDPALDERLTAKENLEIHAVLYGIAKRHRIKVEQLMEANSLSSSTIKVGQKLTRHAAPIERPRD